VVVDSDGVPRKPLGTARANDILQLRRWLMEEETRESKEKLRSTVIKEG
jgi:hypothetical protein